MRRKICVVTSSRADYGLLRPLIFAIKNEATLELQIVATGTHLSPEHGLTYREIENDRLTISRKIDIPTNCASPVGAAKAIGLGVIGFADALCDLSPDLLIVLGDRYEIFSAVSAALIANIPVGHIHGGEVTEGAFDEALRHSITKMSHLHFVAADSYRKRVIQLGEQPQNVHLVGSLGIENIRSLKLLSREELEKSLGFGFGPRNLLITFHPATLSFESAVAQTRELLTALGALKNTVLIFTMPNADPESQDIARLLKDFAINHANAHVFTSLGHLRYLSCMAHVDGVIGNSSSGIIEAPSFGIGTVNIGDRQRGRLQAKSIINCAPLKKEILSAIDRLYQPDFRQQISSNLNPYLSDDTSKKILKVIMDRSLTDLHKKTFFDALDGIT